MDSQGYITLTRQIGLMREMQVVANNIANSATTGFRQEGVIFSEYVRGMDQGESLSMGQANVGATSFEQGTLTQTAGTFDFAIEGEGYFLIETPDGERITRAGSFASNGAGDLVTPDGYRVLDAGGAPVFVPPDAASITVGPDGTMSADGNLVGQIGLVVPVEPKDMTREGGVMFDAGGAVLPAENAKVMQGFVESSNVDTITQLARMIEVQRAYEMGQSFLETEDERVRRAVETMTRSQG